jgi:ankyrin repeat protein
MATIIITGPVEVFSDPGDELITEPSRLKALDGAEEKGANLAEYLDGEPQLEHVGIARGSLLLRYNPKQKRILIVSVYEAPKRLSAKQLKALAQFTRSQWSDGAGEGAFYLLMDKHHVALDLSPYGSLPKINVEQTDRGGKKLKPTPALLAAAEKGDTAKVEKLLNGGADINARGKYGQTALQIAILHDHVKLAALLIERGADVNAADKEGGTPLATAAMASDLASVERLIKAGAEVNRADKEGVTPLMWAANRGSKAIVKLLLENGADPNAADHVKDNAGQTPLMYTQPGAKEVIELLIEHGAKSQQRNRLSQDAIQQALEQARAFDRFGSKSTAARWRKHAEQLKRHKK